MTIGRDLKNKEYDIARLKESMVSRRQGEIVSADPPNKCCAIKLADSPITIPKVKYLSGYYPIPGDVVWVDIKGGDPLVVGQVGGYDLWVQYSPTLFNMSPGTAIARYKRRGMQCEVGFHFKWSGLSGTGALFSFTLPFFHTTLMPSKPGAMHFLDDSTGAHQAGICFIDDGVSTVLFVGPSGIVSGNFGLAGVAVNTNDELSCSLSYEVSEGA